MVSPIPSAAAGKPEGETLEVLLTRREALFGALATAALLAVPGAAVVARSMGTDSLAVLERTVDLIIPETDVPGARATNVHGFIDALMTDWASQATRDQLQDLITEFSAAPDLKAFLESLDRQAYRWAGASPLEGTWRTFKRLVLVGYFYSEHGATRALRYDPLPGEFRGCIPLHPDDLAWAT